MLRKLALAGGLVAGAVAVLAYPVGAVIAADSQVVWLITPHSEGSREIERFAFQADHPDWDPAEADPGDAKTARAVARIYGNPSTEPLTVLWVPEDRIIHPKELPALSLLPQDYKTTGKYWQADTVWLFCKYISLAAAAGAVALLGVWVFLRQRAAGA